MLINFKRLQPGTVRLILGLVLTAQGLAVLGVVKLVRASRHAYALMLQSRDQMGAWTQSEVEAIVCPSTVRASEAKLRPNRPVVGVEIGGKTRAYALDALTYRGGHLVNDMVGKKPVSVVFCDLTQCLRVYTDPAKRAPLDVEVAGLFNSEMVLKIAGALYLQDSSRPLYPETNPPLMPYRQLTPTVTTWGSWIKSHPETDVYIGNSGPSGAGATEGQPAGAR
jgi:hypothetical protein